MKTLTFFVCILMIFGCSYQHTKSLEDRMENCVEGYQIALKSGVRGLTEDVIFNIIVKKMNGYLEDTEQLENELSQLILTCKDESTRRKANLALNFLKEMSNDNIAHIRAVYHDQDKLFNLLEEYSGLASVEQTEAN